MTADLRRRHRVRRVLLALVLEWLDDITEARRDGEYGFAVLLGFSGPLLAVSALFILGIMAAGVVLAFKAAPIATAAVASAVWLIGWVILVATDPDR